MTIRASQKLLVTDQITMNTRNGIIHAMSRIIALFALFVVAAAAQGAYFPGQATTVRAGNVAPVPYANVYVCASGVTCSSTSAHVTVYSDAALTQAITQPIVADAYGNFGFYASPAAYVYNVSGRGIQAENFTITLPPACDGNGNCSAKSIEKFRFADQFSGADIGAKIDAALADFGTAPACGTVFIPTGIYTVSTQILVSGRNGCRFIGGGVGSTVLNDAITGTPANSMWKVSNSSDLVFEGMTLMGTASTGNLVELEGSGSEGRVLFRNIRLSATTGTGKDSSGASMNAAGLYVRNYAGPLEIGAGTLFDYNAQGMVIDNTSAGLISSLNTSHVFGASFLFQTGDGIKFVGGTASVGFAVTHSNFESNGGYGINDPVGISAFVYEGNYFEKNTAGDISEAGSDFGGKIVSNRFLRQNTNPSIVVSTSNSTKSSGIKVEANLFQATTSSSLTLPGFISANFADSAVTNNVYDPFTGVTVTNAVVLGAGASNVVYGGNLSGSFDGGTVSNDLSDPNGAAVANFLGKLEQGSLQVATLSGSEVLANKTLTTPILNGGYFVMQGGTAGNGFIIRASDYATNGGELLAYKQTGLSTAAHIYGADNGGFTPLDIDSPATFTLGLTIPGGQTLTNSGTISGGTVNATTLQQGGAAVALASQLPLTGTTASIGGSALVAGACSSGTVTVTGATTSMVAVANPNTYPGDGAEWEAYVSAANTVTVKVCAIVALTPTASTYNVRVIQ